jgi:hypothetical protein
VTPPIPCVPVTSGDFGRISQTTAICTNADRQRPIASLFSVSSTAGYRSGQHGPRRMQKQRRASPRLPLYSALRRLAKPRYRSFMTSMPKSNFPAVAQTVGFGKCFIFQWGLTDALGTETQLHDFLAGKAFRPIRHRRRRLVFNRRRRDDFANLARWIA